MSTMVPEMMIGQPRAAGLLVVLVDREERGLGVERVEDRLDQEDVAAAVDQALDLLRVRGDDLVPRAVAEARVLDRRRDREVRLVGPDRARDQARPVRLLAVTSFAASTASSQPTLFIS